MGYLLAIEPEPEGDSWSVLLRLNLTRPEINDLFVSGDSMLGWPLEGLERGLESEQGPGLERSSMFVSEVASRGQGIEIKYASSEQAERAAALLRTQLIGIGIEEER